MQIVEEQNIDEIIKVLNNKGVIVYPTDTVYGIGGDALCEEVVSRVREIKQIRKSKPFSLMFGSFSQIKEYCELAPWESEILTKYLPGPYTFIVRKKKDVEIAATGDLTSVGVRIPDNMFCIKLAKKFGKPIITTSANITGEPPPASLEEVDKRILEKVDLAVRGGKTRAEPSTIIDLIQQKIIRGEEVIDLFNL